MKKVLLSTFYAIGFWGSVHLLIAVLEAIHRHNASIINGLRVTKLDVVFGRFTDRPLFFIGSWIVFVITIFIFYWFIFRNVED